MSKFKPGDKVVCTCPIDVLVYGEIYEVEAVAQNADGMLTIKGHEFKYLPFRFGLYQEPKAYVEPGEAPEGHPMPESKKERLQDNIESIRQECMQAMFDWPEFHSAHEGYAVLKEEVDELWDCVRLNPKKRDVSAMKTEAIQVAAMALRFATEICDTKKNNQ